MTLRNMFDSVATEGTLRQLLRQLTFAKTIADVLRVNVENTVTVSGTTTINTAGSSTGAQPPLWGGLSWNSVDARYSLGEQQIATYIQNRERWTFS